jgi:hypothetical protein
MDTKTFTKQQAVAFAQTFIDRKIDEPKSPYAQSQLRWLMQQLAVRCVAETLRQGDGEKELEERLWDAYRILHSLQTTAMREDLREKMWGGKSKLTDAGWEKIEEAKHQVWRRHDPKRAFREGLLSDHAAHGIDREVLAGQAANYLSRPWLQHPTLDWILLDVMLSRETIAFGEHLKDQVMPFPKDDIGLNRRYIDAKGNLEKMREFRWGEFGLRLWIRTFWCLIAPILVIGGSLFFGAGDLAWRLTKGWLTVVAIYLGWRVIQSIARGIGLGHKVDPSAKAMKLWDEMVHACETLQGPVINPTMVRAAMHKARDAGAVWDMAAFSLIDSIVARDAAVWVVDTHR